MPGACPEPCLFMAMPCARSRSISSPACVCTHNKDISCSAHSMAHSKEVVTRLRSPESIIWQQDNTQQPSCHGRIDYRGATQSVLLRCMLCGLNT